MYLLLRLLFFPEISLRISGGKVVDARGKFRAGLAGDIEDISRRTDLRDGMIFVSRGNWGCKIRVFGPLRAAHQQIRNAVSI